MKNQANMLEALSKLDWEANQRSITTRGGCYIASTVSESIAIEIVKLSKIAQLFLQLHREDSKIIEQLKEIIKDM